MKAPIKALIILILFALGVGSYWFVGEKVREEIFAGVEQNPLLQIEDYSKSLLGATFKLTSYGGQLRLLGKIDHGPFIFSKKTLAVASINLTVDPFQVVTSPWKSIIETVPLLKQSHLDFLINLNRTYKVSGNVPELDVTFPSKDGNLILDFSGMVINGSGTDEHYSINGVSKQTKFTGPDQLEMVFGEMVFSTQGKDALSLIPTDWKSDMTLESFAMSWVEGDTPQSVSIDEILATSKGNNIDGVVSAGSLYQVKNLMVSGQSLGDLDYSVQVKGLNEDGLTKMANWFSQIYATTQENPAEPPMIVGAELLPILYKTLDLKPDLEIRVKSIQPSYGENEGIIQVRLLDEKHLSLPARVLAGVSLDLDVKAAAQAARLSMMKSPDVKNRSVESQERLAQSYIDGLSDEGLIEKSGGRYLFNASYNGKEGMVRYGKSGTFPFQLEEFFNLMTTFATQQ